MHDELIGPAGLHDAAAQEVADELPEAGVEGVEVVEQPAPGFLVADDVLAIV